MAVTTPITKSEIRKKFLPNAVLVILSIMSSNFWGISAEHSRPGMSLCQEMEMLLKVRSSKSVHAQRRDERDSRQEAGDDDPGAQGRCPGSAISNRRYAIWNIVF